MLFSPFAEKRGLILYPKDSVLIEIRVFFKPKKTVKMWHFLNQRMLICPPFLRQVRVPGNLHIVLQDLSAALEVPISNSRPVHT